MRQTLMGVKSMFISCGAFEPGNVILKSNAGGSNS